MALPRPVEAALYLGRILEKLVGEGADRRADWGWIGRGLAVLGAAAMGGRFAPVVDGMARQGRGCGWRL
ncbi:MAG: hypothetical protein OXF50_24865 [Caldilineaceae bacterium]|nr:hypothetical protein [Caldilineaceae bacterium]